MYVCMCVPGPADLFIYLSVYIVNYPTVFFILINIEK